MKKFACVLLLLILAAINPVFGQNAGAATDKTPPTQLTKFDLDFPGGSPNGLVAAIEKSMGRPLNAIIPNEYTSLQLPPLKMKGVDAAQLFEALRRASDSVQEYLNVIPGGGSTSGATHVVFGFGTEKPITDSSVWVFYYSGIPRPAKMTRFYQLGPFLDRGFTVDDITTAIQTGWKMHGDSPVPVLSFHKETNILIAVGEDSQLQSIIGVLSALNGVALPAKKASPAPEKSEP